MNKQSLFYILFPIALVVIGLGYLIMNNPQAPAAPMDEPAISESTQLRTAVSEGENPVNAEREVCVSHGSRISYHIHPVVKIFLEGEQVVIPTDVGIDPNCMRSIHTHDTTGTLHVEYPEPFDFTLADFFANWGETFSREEVLGKKIGLSSTITMTVNGEPSDVFERLILRDGDLIEIRYE